MCAIFWWLVLTMGFDLRRFLGSNTIFMCFSTQAELGTRYPVNTLLYMYIAVAIFFHRRP